MIFKGVKTYNEDNFKNKMESGHVGITEYLQLRGEKKVVLESDDTGYKF